MSNKDLLLYNFLENYWLRPENALWQALVANIVKQVKPIGRSLDLGCGDGSFSLICHGGKLKTNMDFFVNAINPLKLFQGNDIYDDNIIVNQPVDIFPEYKISVGADYKFNLLKKCRSLEFYVNNLVLDGNKPFPFKDNYFDYIFTNALYWFDNIKTSLSELNRILENNGTAVIVMLSKEYKEYCLTVNPSGYFKDVLKKINFNRHSNYKYLVTALDFERLLLEHGFKIEKKVGLFSEKFVLLEDIGMRAISPFLITMANNLNIQLRSKIKKEMVDYFYDLFFSIYESEKLGTKKNAALYVYFLKKG